jgi:tetratricopeptide (TPR) repeat protein
MEGEAEYGFWHVLVRDVCYAQIPRAARSERHRAAANWIERRSGERLEDVADVLAYHYQQALELARAAGVADTAELEEGAIRYLGLAGERALGLDVERAEQHLARALELAPADHPERASLLERWAQATQQRGRLREARQALEQAADLFHKRGEPVAAGRVLTRLGLVAHRLGDPRATEQALTEARELLEAEPSGPELVTACAYFAGRDALTGRYAEALVNAERSLALAAELGLPEQAFALHWRGLARCSLGEGDGLTDMRRALELALEQGLGRETGVIHGNLGGVAWNYEGPQAALDAAAEAMAFCERRGITDVAGQARTGIVGALAELGRTQQALAEAAPLADQLEAKGDIAHVYPRVVQLSLHAERGTPEQAPASEKLVATARSIGLPDLIALACAAAAQVLLVQSRAEQAHALLHELEQLENRAGSDYGSVLPSVVRAALALGDSPLAQRLASGIQATTPLHEHALASAQAQLTEADGDHAFAAILYHEAAERWRGFGSVPELAYALLGQGRCLAALGDPEAEGPLREARERFASMGYAPALAETEALLGEGEVAAV